MDFCRFWGLVVILALQVDCRRTYSADGKNSEPPSPGNKTIENDLPAVISSNPNDIRFYAYYRPSDVDARKELIAEDKKSFAQDSYFKNKSLIIIIHGVESSIHAENIKGIKDALLTKKDIFLDSNIVMVDWARLSNVQKPEMRYMAYPIALNHGELVAVKTIRLLRTAIAAKALETLEDVHLIGDGEGAGIAAYIAKHINNSKGANDKLDSVILKGKVGRLTGLDPAGPFFTLIADQDLSLTSTSKKNVNFMDIYHTDQGRIGIVGQIGHADFFPNGGGPFQPACMKADRPRPSSFGFGDFMSSKERNPFDEFSNWVLGMCAHRKASEYFKLSIVDKTHVGCKCTTILDSNCMKKCADSAAFGFYCSPRARGSYQLVVPTTAELEILQGFKNQEEGIR